MRSERFQSQQEALGLPVLTGDFARLAPELQRVNSGPLSRLNSESIPNFTNQFGASVPFRTNLESKIDVGQTSQREPEEGRNTYRIYSNE